MSKPPVTHPQGKVVVDAASLLTELRELIHPASQRA